MNTLFVIAMVAAAVQAADVAQLKENVLSIEAPNYECSDYCALTTTGPCQHPVRIDENCYERVNGSYGTDVCPPNTIDCLQTMPQRPDHLPLDVTPAPGDRNVRGGWTAIMQIGVNDVFQYDSEHWTTDSVYDDGESIKYDAFNNLAFTEVKGCVVETDECVQFTLDQTYPSATALFNGPMREAYGVDQDAFDRVTGLSGRQNCGPSWSGFNVQCRDNNKVRWGYCINIPSQSCQRLGDSDGVIGFGLNGQDCCAMGSGYTNYAVWNSPNAGHEKRVHSVLYVR